KEYKQARKKTIRTVKISQCHFWVGGTLGIPSCSAKATKAEQPTAMSTPSGCRRFDEKNHQLTIERPVATATGMPIN
ncbi:MAG: hypothetical protein ACKVIO_08970, partial [Phycisphaerales bacterium]